MKPTTRRIVLALAAAYAVALLLIAYWPTPVDRPIDGTLTHVLTWLHRHGVPHFIGYNQVEFSANIALFVPLGLLVTEFAPRRLWWIAVAVGFVFSCCIELGQMLFLPHRYASILDVISNTSGALLGALVVLAVRRLTRSEESAADTSRIRS